MSISETETNIVDGMETWLGAYCEVAFFACERIPRVGVSRTLEFVRMGAFILEKMGVR